MKMNVHAMIFVFIVRNKCCNNDYFIRATLKRGDTCHTRERESANEKLKRKLRGSRWSWWLYNDWCLSIRILCLICYLNPVKVYHRIKHCGMWFCVCVCMKHTYDYAWPELYEHYLWCVKFAACLYPISASYLSLSIFGEQVKATHQSEGEFSFVHNT